MSQRESTRRPPRPRKGARLYRVISLVVILSTVLSLLPVIGAAPFAIPAAEAAGVLSIEIMAGHNLVVDSNATSPSTFAPSVATVAGRFCNTGDAPLTNVYGYIGNYIDGVNDTPGIYPSRDSLTFGSTHPLYNTGSYYFTHLGGRMGTQESIRFIGTLAAGECKMQYWHFTYPQCSEADRTPPCSGTPVWGSSIKPDDDLWLEFDIWGRSAEGVNGNQTWRMTMRNEISALANKIMPNPDGRWFNTEADTIEPGGLITSNGILYELGVANQGFDNDGDWVPDYNVWMQPIGNASYDPTCFRLVRTTGVITVTRSGGNPDMVIPFSDLNPPHPVYKGTLYFTNLPPDNTGIRGEVFYTFQALGGPCSAALSPYQEVASGYDNEKFNGDYGVGINPIQSSMPEVVIDKTSNPSIVPLGGTTTYRIPFTNVGDSDFGLGLSTGGMTPLVISDTVPSGMQYVGGSATYSLAYSPNTGVTRRYSTDSGRTWSLTDPGTVLSTGPNNKVVVQWWLNDAFPAGSTGSYAQYQATVPNSYAGSPFIENCAGAAVDTGYPFARECTTIMVPGSNTLGDFVWRDENRDGLQTGELSNGIDGVQVSLYWDKNGDGLLDGGDLLISTQDTAGNGAYDFTQLPDARYIVKVDTADSSIPVGYYKTTADVLAVNLIDPGNLDYNNADFGFGPALSFDKQLSSANPSYEGQFVNYTIKVTNNRPGNGNPPGPCVYTVWGSSYVNDTGQKAWQNPANIVPAPNGLYATAPYRNAGENISVSTWNLGSTPPGTIQKVEVLVPLLIYTPLAGTFNVQLVRGATTYDHTYDVTALSDGTLAVEVTTNGTWAWSDFTGNSTSTSVKLIATKAGNPGGHLDADAVGYRITTDQTCGSWGDTINPLPLTDTFDPIKLQFVSAVPPASSVSGGTINWANVGPVYAGQTKDIIVRFLALQPPDDSDPDTEPDPTTHTNCSSTSGGQYNDGALVNSASDCVTHDIRPGGTIGDRVWADNDNSGGSSMTTGDVGIAGVTLRLYDCGGDLTCGTTDDVLVQTTNTDAFGYYLFRGIPDINRPYQVVLDTTTLPGGTNNWNCTYDDSNPPDKNSRSGPITIDYDDGNTATDDYLGADFSYYATNATRYLIGSIWHDRDNSADPPPPDIGEEGLAGITVRACTNQNCGGTCSSTTTDAGGNFSFTSLSAGTYYVCVDTTTGPLGSGTWSQTWDTDGVGTANRATAVVPSRGYTRVDFSYRRTDTIQLGDTIYADWNGDGVQGDGSPANGNEGEEGLAGVTVRLYMDDGDGLYEPTVDTLLQTQTTNASGGYLFNVTPGGDYLVVVDPTTLPVGYRQTQDPDESGRCVICNNSSDVQNLTATDLQQDFGYRPYGTASIGDFVWRDLDHDGIQDGGSETGIANITVNLYEDSNNNGVIDPGTDALVATTATDANGGYLFSGLHAGNYLVDVDTTDADLPLDGNAVRYILSTGNDPEQVALAAGQAYRDADFGFTPGGLIGDMIWKDNDADGSQDVGEPGIANVTVRLYVDVNGDGDYDAGTDTLYATDTTDANGIYEFASLPAGNYVVVVDNTTLPAGYTQTGDPDLTVACSGPTCDSQSGVTLFPGQVDRSRDFGYRPLGIIGDTVWINPNGNAVQDPGEAGIPWITVRLYTNGADGIPGNGDDVLVQTTETDSDGHYTFGGVASGNYNVRVDTADTDFPSGMVQTYDRDGTLDSITAATGGGTDLGADFGYRLSGLNSVAGTVYHDTDNDAAQDAGETTTYSGVTIYLWSCGNDLICGNADDVRVGSTTTDGSGNYSFPNLPDGRYVVSVNPDAPNLTGLEATNTSSPTTYRTVDLDVAKSNPDPVNAIDQDFGFLSQIDMGDLPSSYGMTTLAQDGARHVIPSAGATYLGSAPPDTESNSAGTAGLDGDDLVGVVDDEDGIVSTGLPWLVGADGGSIYATVGGCSGTCYLSGWVDFNRDGDMNDPGERILLSYPVTNGTQTVYFDVPDGTTLDSPFNSRFRLFTTDSALNALPTGLAYNGEVEDHKLNPGPTAVTLLSFTAAGQPGHILIAWETATEFNNVGFNLYRREMGTNDFYRLNSALIPSLAPGQGLGAKYEFVDANVQPGVTYEYLLEDVDMNGNQAQHGPVTATALYTVFMPLIPR